MTGPAIRISFHVEVVGDRSVIVEAGEVDSFDIDAVKALIEDGLTLRITPDLDDLAHLQLTATEAPAPGVTHEPDAALLTLFDLPDHSNKAELEGRGP